MVNMTIKYSDFGRKLTNDIKKSSLRRFDNKLKISESREQLFNGRFAIGQSVYVDNHLYEVLDVRSNYLVLIDESGNTSKKFPNGIDIVSEQVKFPENTFKGIAIDESFAYVLENAVIKDPFAITKAIAMYNEDNIVECNAILEKQGLPPVNSLFKLNALKLIADALGAKYKPTASESDLIDLVKDKFKNVSLTPEQKVVFRDLSGMLKKQGITLDLNEKKDDDFEDDGEEPGVGDDPNDYENEMEILGLGNLKKKIEKQLSLGRDKSVPQDLRKRPVVTGTSLTDNPDLLTTRLYGQYASHN